jgi:putative transposase
MPYRVSYRRHLPHFQPAGATFHVVAKLQGAIPGVIVDAWRAERATQLAQNGAKDEHAATHLAQQRSHFVRIERILDAAILGPRWLGEPSVAAIVQEALHHRDGPVWDLIAYTIMPNHVHIVMALAMTDDALPPALEDVMGSFKRYTAAQANSVLDRSGPFWQAERFDRVIRDGDELRRTVLYVLNNPVKAGLVQDAGTWPWTYVKGVTPPPK